MINTKIISTKDGEDDDDDDSLWIWIGEWSRQAAAAVSFVQKGLSFMTPILMHGVCIT